MAGTRRLRRTAALLAATVVGAGLLGSITGVAQERRSPRLARALERLRLVTAAYHNEALARASGFEAEEMCVESPQGGMGYHYANEQRIRDDAIHADKPELLLYGPAAGNERALVAVEYWKADRDQDTSTDGDRPRLFGRRFDGPMPGHFPGQPVHYELHVWLWKKNPDGLFAPFNPRSKCPS